MTFEEIQRQLGEVHVAWMIRNPWGLAVARDRARSCTIRPKATQPAYAALVAHIEGLTDAR